MRARNERLTVLSETEQFAYYGLPDFDKKARETYLTLTELEQGLMRSRATLAAQVACALQIGYFKAKQFFFRFTWLDIPDEDLHFILQSYFSKQTWTPDRITKHEYYAQREAIAYLFGYQLWSKKQEPLLREQTAYIILRDINPKFLTTELLFFLKNKKIIRPRYTLLQIVVSDALNNERKRLETLIKKHLTQENIRALQALLSQDDFTSEIAVIKQDAKGFKARMMAVERQKLAVIKPLYQIAKRILPLLNLSKQMILYYASLIHYYTIHDCRERLKPEQTYLYLLCYLSQRYQQLNDNLIDAFCYHLKKFDDEVKIKATAQFYHHLAERQLEWDVMQRLAGFYVDEKIPDTLAFGDVRQKAFDIMPKDKLINTVSHADKKSMTEMDFKWQIIDKLVHRFKNHLRPLVLSLDFTSIKADSPWLSAIQWFKTVFAKQHSLNQYLFSECPQGTIPKRLEPYLIEVTKNEKEPMKLKANRYEFWIYRQLRKQLKVGEIYLEDSIHHRALHQELVSPSEKEERLNHLDIPALRQPIKAQLDTLFTELHENWVSFNQKLKKGNLTHLTYDPIHQSLHSRKPKLDKSKEQTSDFYRQLPSCDISDILQFVNERCGFLAELTPIQLRYTKQLSDDKSLIATIMAQAMNHGNRRMAAISDIPYHHLQTTYQSRLRLATLQASNDLISNDIANMPIFPFYSFDLNLLYGGVDGQKFEVDKPTMKARHSKKYFGKTKGVVAYTLLAMHIPLQLQLIGAHEHESYYVFDIWYHNTTNIIPTAVTGDMHCINKANFAIMHWFGCQLHPRFTDINTQLNSLFCGHDPTEYADYLIKPVGQIDRPFIEDEWPNLERIIATLALKEMSQSILIKKLCHYTQENRTRKALFEYDKLIRSIYTLNYLQDPSIARNAHRSQNRIESYHQLRGAIAQAGGKKQLTGRTDIAIEISNQCGRLIANAVIHYNSAILSKLYEKFKATGNEKGLKMLKKISPVAWDHIHFLGHYLFCSGNCPIDLDAMIDKVMTELM
jgi:TnpA family transposase